MSKRFSSTQRRRLARKALASLAAVVAVSCSDNRATSPDSWIWPAAAPAVRIEVAPTNLSLPIGGQTTLHAQAFDSTGRAVFATFAWNSSDASIATVSRSEATVGIVRAVAAGEATITVSSPSLSATVKVTVGPPNPPAALFISPDELVLAVAETARLTVTANDAGGRPTPVSVDWSSEDPAVATVDRVTGVVTAVGVGTTQVYATMVYVNASITVRVEPPGYLRQWASNATASTEYAKDMWSAAQATGEPNVATCDDESMSWASTGFDVDWLELTYDVPVRPSEIHIYEVWAPGSVVKVEVRDLLGDWHPVYQAQPLPHGGCLRKLTIPVAGVMELVNVVRVTVDQRVRQDWNEIDAVRLSGYRNK